MSKVSVLSVFVVACSPDRHEPLPHAPAISSRDKVEARFAAACGPVYDREAPVRDYYYRTEGYRFRCSFPTKNGETGPVDVVLTTSDDAETADVCNIHIGPSTVDAPVPLDFVSTLFADPSTGARFREITAAIHNEHEYDVSGRARAFGLRIRQEVSQYVKLAGHREGPRFELGISGCEELAPSMQKDNVVVTPGPLAFERER